MPDKVRLVLFRKKQGGGRSLFPFSGLCGSFLRNFQLRNRVDPKIVKSKQHIFRFGVFQPFLQGSIIMGTGIADAVAGIAVRQEAAFFSGVKCKFQNLHAGKTGVFKELPESIRRSAQIFGDKLGIPEPAGDRFQHGHAGPFYPGTVLRCLVSVWYCPVFGKTAEMIDTDHIEQFCGSADPADPPAIAVFAHLIIIIKGIAPMLTVF